MVITMPVTVRNLDFFCVSGGCLQFGAPDSIVAENVKIHDGYQALSTTGNVVLRNLSIRGAQHGISIGSGNLSLDVATIQAATTGIVGTNGSAITISNTLVHGTSDLAIDLYFASGSIVSSTIADAGGDSGTGPRAVRCGNGGTVRSSIIWAPGISARVPIEGCNLVSTIAGPTPAPGALNMNPQFIDAANRDYHLASSSPARDAVDTGPATDFEGDARPQGARFDIGADEAK
jgi:hypothetical protein